MLMTRAYREKLAGGQKEQNNSTYAVVRIRLPEGLILQGEFNAGASSCQVKALVYLPSPYPLSPLCKSFLGRSFVSASSSLLL